MNINEAIEQLKYYQSKPYVPTVKKVCNIALEAIESQQQENEQLRAQVARMREALAQFKYDYEQDCPLYRNYLAVCQLLREDTGIDYHNPADVEALRLARENIVNALYHFAPYDNTVKEKDALSGLKEALAEIDKAIGGDQIE